MDSEPREPTDASFDPRAFVRGLAHEIANPLNALAMNCELLRMLVERGDIERIRVASAQLLAANARCSSLMHGLQSFGTALRRAEPETVSACRLLHDAAADLIKSMALPAPRLVINGEDAQVRVDRVALQRVIGSLLRNSAEAGSDLVEVDIRKDDRTLAIGVHDNGSGFASDYSDAPFYSTHRTPTNHGLGLTLAREILRVNHGSLAILPAEKGALVELRLPIDR